MLRYHSQGSVRGSVRRVSKSQSRREPTTTAESREDVCDVCDERMYVTYVMAGTQRPASKSMLVCVNTASRKGVVSPEDFCVKVQYGTEKGRKGHLRRVCKPASCVYTYTWYAIKR